MKIQGDKILTMCRVDQIATVGYITEDMARKLKAGQIIDVTEKQAETLIGKGLAHEAIKSVEITGFDPTTKSAEIVYAETSEDKEN